MLNEPFDNPDYIAFLERWKTDRQAPLPAADWFYSREETAYGNAWAWAAQNPDARLDLWQDMSWCDKPMSPVTFPWRVKRRTYAAMYCFYTWPATLRWVVITDGVTGTFQDEACPLFAYSVEHNLRRWKEVFGDDGMPVEIVYQPASVWQTMPAPAGG